jgi:hypothetical protein
VQNVRAELRAFLLQTTHIANTNTRPHLLDIIHDFFRTCPPSAEFEEQLNKLQEHMGGQLVKLPKQMHGLTCARVLSLLHF